MMNVISFLPDPIPHDDMCLSVNPIMNGEVWLPVNCMMIPNIRFGYYVSNYGRVFSNMSDKIMAQTINKKGYCRLAFQSITGGKISVSVHRVVLLAFGYIQNHRDLHVNHIDGVKTNNYLGNLEWVTPAQNTLHAYANGLTPTGKSYEMHDEFTDELAHKTCQLYMQGYSMTQITNILNCGMHGIFNLLHGKSRKHILDQYDIQFKDKYVINKDQKVILMNIFDEFFNEYKSEELVSIYPYICRMINLEDTRSNRDAIRKIFRRDYLKNK